VKRVHDNKDRRGVKVDLTAKGKRIAKKLKITVQKKWEFLLSRVSRKDQENYVKILRKIKRGIQ
jgi:DNA-binding MarR family transcriptional regulator